MISLVRSFLPEDILCFHPKLITNDLTSLTDSCFCHGIHSNCIISALFQFSQKLQLAYDPIKIIFKVALTNLTSPSDSLGRGEKKIIFVI